MKKMSRSSSTSMNDVTITSGSSLRPERRRKSISRAHSFYGLHQLDGFFFHLDHQRVNSSAQMAITDNGRNRDGQACRSGDERFGNAARQDGGIADALRR